MADDVIADDLLELLRKMDTPTVCNAIEVAQGKRGSTVLLVVPCGIANRAIQPLWVLPERLKFRGWRNEPTE